MITRLPGNPQIEVQVRRSARARRYALRVSASNGAVTLTVPARAPLDEGLAFLHEKADWVRAHLARQPARPRLGHGAALPIEGIARTIAPGEGRAVRLGDDHVAVPGPEAEIGARLRGFLRARARARLAMACAHHASAAGLDFGRLTLRDTRSRWGSCTAAGNLMFSWRLVMAPPAVLDYVAAHEVAHRAEMNHSPAFWAVVARLCPDYATHRAWLRREGPGLLLYEFGAEPPAQGD